MIIGIPSESYPGETRVAVSPHSVEVLKKKGLQILIEEGAGLRADFTDQAYKDKGAELCSRNALFEKSEVILQVRLLGANPTEGRKDLSLMRRGQLLIGLLEPYTAKDELLALGNAGVTAFALELIPRITRAQSMDVLSSQASLAGYKAVILAADALGRIFPMMMTAAGTITGTKAFVVGAGVAGLQAIATARRLGASVQAYDVRAAVKEQVQSLGAKFVELGLDDTAEGSGGYARAMDEAFYKRQREVMTKVIAANDVVITTAAVPGKKAPLLVTADMISGMAPGSVVVDLAAERGGNCELTKPGETVVVNGVKILGPLNLPATVPYHASQTYATNISTFLLNMILDGQLNIDLKDEITAGTLVVRDSQIVHSQVREALGL